MSYKESINNGIFKAYDIRGIYPEELAEPTANLIAQTYLKILAEKLSKPIKDLKIAVCQDNRKSSAPLMQEVIKVFLEYGVSVDDLGPLSINDYYFAVGYYKYDGGIMATASHNPPQYGGFKMTTINTEYENSIDFLSGQELYQELQDFDFPLTAEKTPGYLQSKNVLADHLKHILSFIDKSKIKNLKVVVDTGNGMTGLMIPKIFAELPCQLTHIFSELDGDFSNRAPNPLTAGASDKLAEKVLAEKADLGVIFDVDGDRMFLVDEKGKLVRGDMVLLLLAKPMLEKNIGAGITYNLICSHAVKDLVSKWSGRPIRSEVGYRNLARHMREDKGIMSGEVSAHFAFRDNFYADSGFIAMVLALEAISSDGRPLSEIIKDFQTYVKSDELNFEVSDINLELAKFKNTYQSNLLDEIDGLTFEFSTWWFNVRASNTEPLLRLTVEANSSDILAEKIKELESLIDFKARK
ncbi:MAG: phosphomannomutase/phosphoglucomutase [bacterium]|nr:phosphomannomutase/phosphoglucomutase [bacterium]